MGFVNMDILVFLLAALFSGIAMRNGSAGFIIGVLSYIIYKHGQRISSLESERGLEKDSATSDNIKSDSEKWQETEESDEPQETMDDLTSSTPIQTTVPPAINFEETSTPEFSKSESTPLQAPSISEFSEESASGTLQDIFGPAIANFLTRGNPIARIGAVILFLGVGFALKLVADVGYLPPEVRLITAAIFSIALLVVGWKMRHHRGQFAVTLQGTGIGIFYITTFIAYKMYDFIPSSLTFVFLLAITILSGVLAVVGNTRSLALLSVIGGFLAPILASDGGGNYIALFSYIAMLNLGIFAMCFFRSWKSLNLTGFIFTFFISATWAEKFYVPEMYANCQFFIILFAFLYTLINIIYSVKKSEESKASVDTLMTFGTPVLYSLLQWKLVEPFEYGTAISSAFFGAFHILIARILYSKFGSSLRMLVESYLSIGIILITIAVPFTFDGRVSSAIWALEASALIWNGIRQERSLLRILGIILLPLSSILFLSDATAYSGGIGFLNQHFIGIFLLTAGHLISGTLLVNAPESVLQKEERQVGIAALWCSGLWWTFGGLNEVKIHLNPWREWFYDLFQSTVWVKSSTFNLSIYSIFVTLSILAFWTIFSRFKLPGKKVIHGILIPAHCCLLFISGEIVDTNLFGIAGIFSWPLFFIVNYFILFKEEKPDATNILSWQHRIGLWFFIYIVTVEIAWIASQYASLGWKQGAVIFVPAFFALVVCSKIRNMKQWPFNLHSDLYCSALWLPVSWSMVVSAIFNFISSGNTAPLPYIPLLNALDIAQATAGLAFITWTTRMVALERFSDEDRANTNSILGVWSFVWATSTLLRVIHHTTGIPWSFVKMFDSNLVQASLSIFWSVLALTLMLLAHKKHWRQLWKVGGLLIGAVVVKLFIIDLSNHGTVGRIVAFLGVGLLMLGIGYLVPIPPERETTKE